jgi:hypothetical protein
MVYDFIVVGSGPAGSILSNQLAIKGFKIALIDRAKNEKSKLINDFLCPYINKCPKFYSPVYSDQLGGNSALWHSKIYLLSRDEFNNYEWGFDYEELEENSKILSKALGLENDLISKFDQVNKEDIYRYSMRAKFRNMYEYLNIKKNQNIKVYKGYSPIKLVFNNEKVTKIIISNGKKNNFILSLNYSVIFCAGGLGNPHLLMNLLPKKNYFIGKFLSDHPHVNLGKVLDKKFKKFTKIAKPNVKENLNIKSDEVALIKKKNNIFAGIQLDYKTDPSRRLKRFFIKISNIQLRKLLSMFNFLILKLNGLYFKLGIFFNRYYKYSFEFFFSQTPDKQNQISLSGKVDKFGLKKINIDWDIKNNDTLVYNNLIEETLGIKGQLISSNKNINFNQNFYNHGIAGLHPSCTTRISNHPKGGAVNPSLKLFDYSNIYVCGSSVFPFIGYTNPTWTIMTLALRLSKTLLREK